MTRQDRIHFFDHLASVARRVVADASSAKGVPMAPELAHRLRDLMEAAEIVSRLADREIVHLEAARDWPEGVER